MPLTPHEQRILDEIERRLAEEDPRLVESVRKASVSSHALRRVRWGLIGFVLGFVLMLFFVLSMWFAVAGFAIMLVSGLVVYQYLKRMGRDQLRAYGEQHGGHFSITGSLARLMERFRKPRPNG
jgi:hypothetical protein